MMPSQHQGAAPFSLLKPEEAAERLNVSRTTLYRMVDRRAIAVYRIGGVLRFSLTDIEASARRFEANNPTTYGRPQASQ
ncbi:helix-turn-helix domain-containing protein [Candidatus Uhrbacteria bacterium]|nr:helix-turn-helix domain-containing protein [Candidatus Uhrbacteria bacterium]